MFFWYNYKRESAFKSVSEELVNLNPMAFIIIMTLFQLFSFLLKKISEKGGDVYMIIINFFALLTEVVVMVSVGIYVSLPLGSAGSLST